MTSLSLPQTLFCFLVLLIAASLLPTTTGISFPKLQPRDDHPSPSPPSNCETEGNGDLYGKGVRIGLYLQCFATIIIRELGTWQRGIERIGIRSGVGRVRTGTNVICGSIMLSCTISIFNRQALPIDYDIVLYLVAFLFLPGNSIFTGSAGFVHPAMIAAYGSFGVWFQLKGIAHVRTIACGHIMNILGLPYGLNGVMFTLILVVGVGYTGLALAPHVWSLICRLGYAKRLQQIVKAWNSPYEIQRYGIFWFDPEENPFLFAVDPSISKTFWEQVLGFILLRDLFVFARVSQRCLNLERPVPSRAPVKRRIADKVYPHLYHMLVISVWLAYTLIPPLVGLIGTERMLQINNLTTAEIKTSTGQMIALLTGIFSFMRAMEEVWQFLVETFRCMM